MSVDDYGWDDGAGEPAADTVDPPHEDAAPQESEPAPSYEEPAAADSGGGGDSGGGWDTMPAPAPDPPSSSYVDSSNPSAIVIVDDYGGGGGGWGDAGGGDVSSSRLTSTSAGGRMTTAEAQAFFQQLSNATRDQNGVPVPIGEGDIADLARRNPEDVETVKQLYREQYQLRARRTASAGGTGGDADLDGDSIIDVGWLLVDAQPGDPRLIRAGDVGNFDFSGVAHPSNIDVGGVPVRTLFGALGSPVTAAAGAATVSTSATQRAPYAAPQAPGGATSTPNTVRGPSYALAVAGTPANPQSSYPALVPGPASTAAAGGGGIFPAIAGGSSLGLLAIAALVWYLWKS